MKVNALGVYVGSTHRYLEAVNHPDCHFNKEDLLSSETETCAQQAGQHSLRTGPHSTVYFTGQSVVFFSYLIMNLQDQLREIYCASILIMTQICIANWLPEFVKFKFI